MLLPFHPFRTLKEGFGQLSKKITQFWSVLLSFSPCFAAWSNGVMRFRRPEPDETWGCLDWWMMDYWLQTTEVRAPAQLPRSRWKTEAQLYARHLIFTHIYIYIGRSTGRNFPSAGDFVKVFWLSGP